MAFYYLKSNTGRSLYLNTQKKYIAAFENNHLVGYWESTEKPLYTGTTGHLEEVNVWELLTYIDQFYH